MRIAGENGKANGSFSKASTTFATHKSKYSVRFNKMIFFSLLTVTCVVLSKDTLEENAGSKRGRGGLIGILCIFDEKWVVVKVGHFLFNNKHSYASGFLRNREKEKWSRTKSKCQLDWFRKHINIYI